MKPKILFILFCLISVINVYSSDSEKRFYGVNNMYGISLREMASVCKDNNGFIWTSSKSGIIRVSDSDYRIYQLPYRSANVINVRLTFCKGRLLAYTNNGQIFTYSELYDKFFFTMDVRNILKDPFISLDRVVIDGNNNLWMNTSAGFCEYIDGKIIRINNGKITINSISLYDDNHLFVALQDKMLLLDCKNLRFKQMFRFSRNVNVSSIFFDRKKNIIWIGTTTDGLYCYDIRKKNMQLIESLPKQPINVIKESPEGSLLIGTDGKGIWEIDKESKSVLSVYKEDLDNPFSLSGNGVYDIYCDSNRKVWVATYSGGLSSFNWNSTLVKQISHQINNGNSLGNNNVNKIFEDNNKTIWFATNNGIYNWNPKSNKWTSYYKNKEKQAQVFQTLCEDDENRIWAGTYSSGFYLLDKSSGRELAHYPNSSTPNISGCNFVMNIYKDSDGDMWIGGIQNLICYSKNKKQFRVYDQQPMRAFKEFSKGKILLGCTYSLILLEKESGKISYLADCLAQDIAVKGNDIWVATSGDGLLHYNYKTKKKYYITMDDGLPSNFINSVIFDKGYLWIGTENGLCKYNPKNKAVSCFFNIAFASTSFNNTAVCKLRSGEMIWGTNNGAMMFDPQKLSQSSVKGKFYLQDITIAGNSIRENERLLDGIPVNKHEDLSFKYDQNTLSIEVLPIGITANEVKFSWKMEGLDTKWTLPSNQQAITYTNIPNGSYKLKIRMLNNSLSQVIAEREINITVIPMFWQTWWLRMFMIIFILTLIIFLMRMYISRLKQRHNEDKIRFFTNMAHDLRTSITLIKAPIQELNKEKSISDKGHFYLNLAAEQSDRLSNVATQLLDFQKVDLGKGQMFLVMTDIVTLVFKRKTMFSSTAMLKNINIDYTCNVKEYITAVDELKIEKVIDNLLSNAIKYSFENSTIEVKLECNETSWKLSVTDHGLGISEHAQKKLFKEFYRGDNKINSYMVGSGIGLLLVKNYVMLHNGSVVLDSKENCGSTFIVNIPYKEVSYEAVTKEIKPDVFSFKDMKSDDIQMPEEEVEKTKTVLVVDDNADLRKFIKSSFDGEYNILEADSGVTAWDLLKSESPDLIVSDVMMPDMDGFELCKLIKSSFQTSHIPVILLTSLCERSKQLEGLGLGAEDYMTKPFDMSLLKQRIMTLIRNRDIIKNKVISLVKSDKEEDEKIMPNELNDNFVKKAVEIIESNISNIDFDKESFANQMNVSPSLLYKKMKSLTGQSPTEFIKDIRLNKSLELLKSNKYSITEVSEMCGYSSISYFSTVFKKNFGKSPTEV